MANHPLYIGGAPTRNYSRAMFPAPPYSVNNPDQNRVKVSAHKNPAQFDLNRTLDFKNEAALAEYVRNSTFANADTLDVILLPKRTLMAGVLFSVEVAGPAGLILTPSIVAGAAPVLLPAIPADVVDDGLTEGFGFAVPGDAAWMVASAEVAQMPYFAANVGLVRLTVTGYDPALGFGNLKLHICPVVTKFEGGAW